MKLLDTDKDNHIGFFDFLSPILHVVPPEVITAFTQDQRFKQETFNDLRMAFDAAKNSVAGVVSAEVDHIRNKLFEKGIEQSKQLGRALDQLLSLTKHQEGTPIGVNEFHLGILRLEKRTMLTFTSKLYQEEEVRLRGMLSQQPAPFVPEYALK